MNIHPEFYYNYYFQGFVYGKFRTLTISSLSLIRLQQRQRTQMLKKQAGNKQICGNFSKPAHRFHRKEITSTHI